MFPNSKQIHFLKYINLEINFQSSKQVFKSEKNVLKVASESLLIDHHIKIMSPLSEFCLFLYFYGLGGTGGDGQGAFLGCKDRVFL